MTVTDYRDLVKVLRQIDPALLREMRKNIRNDADPLRKSVRQGIPVASPLRGMRPDVNKIGRLAWGRGKQANSAVISTKVPRGKSPTGRTSLAKIVVSSAATVMADMAGKSGAWVGKRPLAKGTGNNKATVPFGKYKGQVGYRYTYHTAEGTFIAGRIHRNTGRQGRAMISKLNNVVGHKASHFVWPKAEQGLPAAKDNIRVTLNHYIDIVNRELRSR